MTHTWATWLKKWRMIADEATSTEYTSITKTEGEVTYEVLRISRFHDEYDGLKQHVKTPIRAFNDNIALHSRATRDLGVVRVITNKGMPEFVVEPGADALEWIAQTQGVTVKALIAVMRTGDLGRRVSRRDRLAAKNSRNQLEAVERELTQELEDVRTQEVSLTAEVKALNAKIRAMKIQRDGAIKDRDSALREAERMRANLIKHNAEHPQDENSAPSSGAMACVLGTAKDRGVKITSNKPLPGSFSG